MKQETEARDSSGDSDRAPPEWRCYRFVSTAAALRRQRLVMMGLLLTVPAGLFLLFGNRTAALLAKGVSGAAYLPVLPFVLMLLAAAVFACRRKSIEVDCAGIAFKGFWGGPVPRRIGWQELTRVRTADIPLPGWKNFDQTLVFFFRAGTERLFPFRSGRREMFRGAGHSLSLLQAIEIFAGPVGPLSDDERSIVPSLEATLDIGREVGQVAAAALGMMLIAVALMFTLPVRALPEPVHRYFYWGAAVLAALLALWHMRHIRRKFNMLGPAIMIAGVSAFLMLPGIAALPLLLGNKIRPAFFLIGDSADRQVWETLSVPPLRLTIAAPPQQRAYREIDTRLEMTLYRGPGRLISVDRAQYRALWRLPEDWQED